MKTCKMQPPFLFFPKARDIHSLNLLVVLGVSGKYFHEIGIIVCVKYLKRVSGAKKVNFQQSFNLIILFFCNVPLIEKLRFVTQWPTELASSVSAGISFSHRPDVTYFVIFYLYLDTG